MSATQYLARTSAAIRVSIRSDRKLSRSASPKIDELAGLAAGTDETQRNKIMAEALQSLQKRINLIVDAQNESDALHRLRDEESDALWWVTGQHSMWLGRPFTDIDAASASTLAGFELASLVRLSPGPFAAPALLSRVLDESCDKPPKRITIKELARQFPFDATTGHLKNSQGVLTPVLQIVSARDSSTWQDVAASIHIDEKAAISPLDLARQAYDETLLSSLLDEPS